MLSWVEHEKSFITVSLDDQSFQFDLWIVCAISKKAGL